MLSVQCAFPFHISFASDDRNDRTAGTTGKPERPESQNGRKAETTGKAGTTGLIIGQCDPNLLRE
jgi:hypothetical protein